MALQNSALAVRKNPYPDAVHIFLFSVYLVNRLQSSFTIKNKNLTKIIEFQLTSQNTINDKEHILPSESCYNKDGFFGNEGSIGHIKINSLLTSPIRSVL